MPAGKASKTLIILILVLLPLSATYGDDKLYCVSLKRDFKISGKIYYGIMNFKFKVTNAEVYNILHKPLGWVLNASKGRNGEGGFGGCILQFTGSIKFDFFYDDFVIIKKNPGVKIDDVKLILKLGTDEYPAGSTGEKKYNFTNKDFNIRRCADRPY
ncbi:MAG: hypothetical protein L7F77_14130 [Candidatus Magnetominusculus sp. LBB02]|nr:hypothetical protein [Candidatus Magnetominusculus sp. LBB02]